MAAAYTSSSVSLSLVLSSSNLQMNLRCHGVFARAACRRSVLATWTLIHPPGTHPDPQDPRQPQTLSTLRKPCQISKRTFDVMACSTVRPRSVSSLCPCRLNLDSRQCPGPTPAAPSPPSEPRSGHFKQLPANMFGGSERDIEKSCTCHAQRRRRCRNRNSQRRALVHAWPSRGPPSWNNTLPT